MTNQPYYMDESMFMNQSITQMKMNSKINEINNVNDESYCMDEILQ